MRVGTILNHVMGLPNVSKPYPAIAARGAPYAAVFDQVAHELRLPRALLQGIAAVESGMERMAVNPDSGTVGLMQIHPIHFSGLGWQAPIIVNRVARTGSGGAGWFDVEKNIRAGAAILARDWERELDVVRALARYNGAATWLRGDPQPQFEAYWRRVVAYANVFQS